MLRGEREAWGREMRRGDGRGRVPSRAKGVLLAMLVLALAGCDDDISGATAFGDPGSLFADTGFQDSAASLTCGNGRLEQNEQCDPRLLFMETCQSLGLAPGQLLCGGDCRFDFRQCGQAISVEAPGCPADPARAEGLACAAPGRLCSYGDSCGSVACECLVEQVVVPDEDAGSTDDDAGLDPLSDPEAEDAGWSSSISNPPTMRLRWRCFIEPCGP